MSEATGVLEVKVGAEHSKFEWNGKPQDRERAKAEFEKRMNQGGYLAVVQDGPRTAHQVRTFEEVEKTEKERGTVTVTISPALIGG